MAHLRVIDRGLAGRDQPVQVLTIESQLAGKPHDLEGKDWHGLRRFRRRGLARVRQETYLIGWVLNLKRLARALPPQVQPV